MTSATWTNASAEHIMADLTTIARALWEQHIDESRRVRLLMMSTSPLALWQVYRAPRTGKSRIVVT